MRGIFALSLMMPLLTACTTVSQVATRMVQPESAAQGAFSEKTQDSLYLGVIDGLIKQRRYEAALAFLDEYKQASPRAVILRGDALVGAGRPYDAVAVYKAATGSNYAAAAYNGMGRAQSALGIWAAAVENFRRASAVEPANAEYLNNLGYARLHLGARDSLAVASDNLRRAHQLNPDSATIRNNLILAARITNNHARMTALLDTIGDARERREVAEFTQKWTGKDNEQASHRDGGLP